MNWHCTIKLVSILYFCIQVFLAGCGDVEENKSKKEVISSYVPFPPQPAPELTPQEKKLLERDDFVRIEPGEFEMGSPSDEPGHSDDETKHLVRITKPFYMGKFEVTVNQWNMLQPQGLKRDGNFSLPEELSEMIIKVKQNFERKVSIKPNPLALDPNGHVYTVRILEQILSILQRKQQEEQEAEKKGTIQSYLKKLEKFIRERNHLPLTDISYPQAKSFCWRRTEQAWKSSTIPKSMVFRLPTEAEWEYACRAGLPGVCGLEEGNTLSGMNANLDGGKKAYIIGKETYLINKEQLVPTAVIRSKYPPNIWGIHDMHGNVYEWCHDYYGFYPDAPTIDPLGPIRGEERVIRGGSFLSTAHQCRSAARHAVEPSWRGSEIGFRLVLGYPL